MSEEKAVTSDEWAEQERRALNVFLGHVRHQRIQGAQRAPEAATPAFWRGEFEAWKKAAVGDD